MGFNGVQGVVQEHGQLEDLFHPLEVFLTMNIRYSVT